MNTLNAPLNADFYEGSGTSLLVPRPYDCAIDGHGYMLDFEFKPWKRQAFQHNSVAPIRAQADTSNQPSESSLNPEGLWRRTVESWLDGAGQVHLDRKDSDANRFRSSKGIDIWTKWQLSLLHDTAKVLNSANTNLGLAVAGIHLYVIDGQTLKFTTDLSTWTTVTGTPAVAASSICSDGANIYVAYGADGIYTTTAGGASASQYVTDPVDAATVIGFVMGRLMVGFGAHLYNVVASGALPSPLVTVNYPSIAWVGFAEGQAVIYAAGYSGDKSVIYRIGITSDGTALDAPVVAGSLPPGEIVRTVYGLVGGNVMIGSDLGWRFAEASTTAGDLDIGALTTTTSPVKALAAYDRFGYGALTDYDSTSTGLFRADPTNFTQPLVPAWTSDLMATAQGTVTSVAFFAGSPVFSVAGVGVYGQAATYVPSGSLDSGFISYGISDQKVPVFLDVSTAALVGTIQSYVSYDGGVFTLAGTSATNGSTFEELPLPQTLSYDTEVRTVLNAGASNTATPILDRWTLRSIPAPVTPTDLIVPIILAESVNSASDEGPMVPFDELAFLDGLRTSKKVVTYQEGSASYTVVVQDMNWVPEGFGNTHAQHEGVLVITMRTVV